MQDPSRNNLLKIMLKNFSAINRSTFLHRIVCLGKDQSGSMKCFMESVVKEMQGECSEKESLVGLGLFYDPYVINIIESSEENITKYLKQVMLLLKSNPPVELKVLVFVPHISKVYFPNWVGKTVRPPVSSKSLLASTDKNQHLEMAKLCLGKLYRLSFFVDAQPPSQYHTTLENLSKTCQQDIPEAQLVDFLISSPLLMPVSKYLEAQDVTPWKSIQDIVWPVPPSFVPYNIIKKDDDDNKKEEMVEEENQLNYEN